MSFTFNPSFPIVDENGVLTDVGRTLLWNLYEARTRYGDGSPEGVLTAPLYSLYIDRTGVSGSIAYRKMSIDIAGDRTKGWILE